MNNKDFLLVINYRKELEHLIEMFKKYRDNQKELAKMPMDISVMEQMKQSDIMAEHYLQLIDYLNQLYEEYEDFKNEK